MAGFFQPNGFKGPDGNIFHNVCWCYIIPSVTRQKINYYFFFKMAHPTPQVSHSNSGITLTFAHWKKVFLSIGIPLILSLRRSLPDSKRLFIHYTFCFLYTFVLIKWMDRIVCFNKISKFLFLSTKNIYLSGDWNVRADSLFLFISFMC